MLSAYAKAIILITQFALIYQILSINIYDTIQIEDFHAHSFVPNEIIVSYAIDNGDTINLNLSVLNQFPGKLLMHIFVRQLANEPGGQWSSELIKLKNMDFCKTLESLRNLTLEEVQGESVLPQTFLISCPLKPGFYYVKDGRFQIKLLPIQIPNGRYLVQFELIQVYEEVIKLLSCRIKCKKFVPIDVTNQTTKFTWSDEEEEKVMQKTPTKSTNETGISGEVDNEQEETEDDNKEEQEEDDEENQMQEDENGDDEEQKQEDDEEQMQEKEDEEEEKQEDDEEHQQEDNDEQMQENEDEKEEKQEDDDEQKQEDVGEHMPEDDEEQIQEDEPGEEE